MSSCAINRNDLVSVGKITSPHGVRGEVKVALLTDFPERIYRLQKIYLVRDQEVRGPYTVAGARLSSGKAILKFAETGDRDAATELKGWEVAVTKSEAVELPPGHYYHFQLVGLPVYTLKGEYLGRVSEIINLPANDVYAVKKETGEELLLPATHEVVTEVNLEEKYLRVNLLPGLG